MKPRCKDGTHRKGRNCVRVSRKDKIKRRMERKYQIERKLKTE